MSGKQITRLRRIARRELFSTVGRGWRAIKRLWARNPQGFDATVATLEIRRADFMAVVHAMNPKQAAKALEEIRAKAPEQAPAFERLLRLLGKI